MKKVQIQVMKLFRKEFHLILKQLVLRCKNESIEEIESMAETQNREMEEVIEKQSQHLLTKYISRNGRKSKRYRIVDAIKTCIRIKLPQFFLEVQQSDIFGTEKSC
jgi:hypothetical protein